MISLYELREAVRMEGFGECGAIDLPNRRAMAPGRSAKAYELVAGGDAGRFPHAFRDDADLFDARALGGVDHLDDVLIFQGRIADDEHRLVGALLEDVPQPRLELDDGNV